VSRSFTKHFTPEEANKLLPLIKPIVSQVAVRASMLDQLFGRQRTEIIRENERLVRQLAEMGVQMKDFRTGLIDFPAVRFGEEVLLCWKLGESEVSFWHNLTDGYRGRRPLKPELHQIR
jgi:hypothetical protein